VGTVVALHSAGVLFESLSVRLLWLKILVAFC